MAAQPFPLSVNPSVRKGISLDRYACRLVLILWVCVGVAVSVRTLLNPARHTVFPVFAAGATRWWADLEVYASDPALDDFRYPPTFAVAISPLSALGLSVGGILWSWLSLVVLLAGLLHFARQVLALKGSGTRLAIFLGLGMAGALRGLWNAQSNALVVGVLLLGGAELARRHWWRAAFLLSLTVWIKLIPMAPALLLGALYPRRLAPRLALALVVVALLPFLTRTPVLVLEHYREWFEHLAHTGSKRWPGFRDGWTLWVVLRHSLEGASGPLALKTPLDSPVYRVLQLLSAAGILLWCLWLKKRGTEDRQLINLALAMSCAWLMLFGPAVEHATYVFLTAPLAWAILEEDSCFPRGRWLLWPAFILIMLLGWGSLARPVAEVFPPVLAALPLGTILFASWLIGYVWRSSVIARRQTEVLVRAFRVPAPIVPPAGVEPSRLPVPDANSPSITSPRNSMRWGTTHAPFVRPGPQLSGSD
jgi:hypothetical protein